MPDPSIGWHPHPEVWLLVVGLEAAYLIAVLRRRAASRPGDPGTTPGQIVAFTLGVGAMWAAGDWPVHELAEERLLSVHMGQHLLLSLIAPPLLLLGTPGWLARRLIPRPILRMVRPLARPIPALLLFNGFLALSHWPDLVDLSLRSEGVHFSLHAVLFVLATVMWMPVLSPVLEIRRLHYPGQMLYLFAQSIVPTVPASFLTFGSSPLYPFYVDAAPLAGLDALTDQRIAGLAMKLLGGLILWGIIAVLFFRWHAQEEATGADALEWQDVDREVGRVPLSSR